MSQPLKETNMDFQSLRIQVMDEYQAGRVQEALDLLNRHGEGFPERRELFTNWRACFLSLLGRAEEAVATLQEGVDRGYWWPAAVLTDDPDLAALQARPDFQALVAACVERHQTALKNAKPERIVLEPLGVAPDQPRPLILAMHGRNGNLHDNEEHWATATRLGWQVVLIGSSQVVGSNGYGWDDRDLALKELRQHLDEVCQNYPIDRSRIVLAGFSQSG
ncbi:MAG TPA: hypothetical protein VFF68_03225, partial [Anaerolineaceae bacterium]|nr:hypothetical protein [Anaerolineaceae bacterium]